MSQQEKDQRRMLYWLNLVRMNPMVHVPSHFQNVLALTHHGRQQPALESQRILPRTHHSLYDPRSGSSARYDTHAQLPVQSADGIEPIAEGFDFPTLSTSAKDMHKQSQKRAHDALAAQSPVAVLPLNSRPKPPLVSPSLPSNVLIKPHESPLAHRPKLALSHRPKLTPSHRPKLALSHRPKLSNFTQAGIQATPPQLSPLTLGKQLNQSLTPNKNSKKSCQNGTGNPPKALTSDGHVDGPSEIVDLSIHTRVSRAMKYVSIFLLSLFVI